MIYFSHSIYTLHLVVDTIFSLIQKLLILTKFLANDNDESSLALLVIIKNTPLPVPCLLKMDKYCKNLLGYFPMNCVHMEDLKNSNSRKKSFILNRLKLKTLLKKLKLAFLFG